MQNGAEREPLRIPSERQRQSYTIVTCDQITAVPIWNLSLPYRHLAWAAFTTWSSTPWETSNGALLVSEGRATLQGRICAGNGRRHCQEGVHNTAGTKKGTAGNTRWVEWAEVEMVQGGEGYGRLRRVPKLPASDDQSVHQHGLRGARGNSSAGRTKKHPPWESAFSAVRCRVMDWVGQCTQCICEERGCVGVVVVAGVCQKNTSTLLLECTKIFKSSIFISLFHTSDVRMNIRANGSVQQKV